MIWQNISAMSAPESADAPVNRPSMKKWVVLLVVLGALIGLGTMVKAWMDKRSGAAAQPVVFSGGSEHWDQNEVPISMQCGACHEKEFRQWAGSDHAWAFRKLGDQWESEAFHNMKLDAHGSILQFSTNGHGRMVHDGQSSTSWRAEWATGRIPLVQYLVPAKDGGFHTLSAAWDVNRKEWFDIFGKESRQPGDWGHWTGRGMNWNTQCAWCHMSLFHKNYDPGKDRYASTWTEPGVTCIQCHGPLLDKPEAGTGCMISTRNKLTPQQIHDNCASCHARRDEFDHDFAVGDRFDNHFQLVLPVQPGVFWPNGMQRDEDYCETGLRLSRMGKAGVTCLDCHDPHTGTLKLPQEDNTLCLRCHGTGEAVNGVKAPVIDMATHTPCPQSSMGARCVECHMPESLYMARDPRRDHSFNSPDPLLSVELGIPNACTMCHEEKSNEWAAEAVKKYYGAKPKMAQYRERTRAVQHAYEGKEDVLPLLMECFKREEVGAWRATLLDLMDAWAHEPAVQEVAAAAVKDPDPLTRAAAAKVMGRVGNPAAGKLLNDPFRVVRLQAEWALRDSLPPDSPGMKELTAAALHQADQPSGAMKLAQIAISRKDVKTAELWFSKALKWDATSSVVHRDYAVFLASQGRSREAVDQMQEAVRLAPRDANLWYLLGLGQIENNDEPGALESFNEALKIEPSFIRALFNRALLNEKVGRLEQALQDLENCSSLEKGNADIPFTLAVMLYRNGRYREAAAAAAEALRRDPGHARARQILESASRHGR